MSLSVFSCRGREVLFVLVAFSSLQIAALGDDGPLVKLLKSGRVPEARQGAVVEMIGKRGTVDDLTYLYEQALLPTGFSAAVKAKALFALAEAAENRRLRPAPTSTSSPRSSRPMRPEPTRHCRSARSSWQVSGRSKPPPMPCGRSRCLPMPISGCAREHSMRSPRSAARSVVLRSKPWLRTNSRLEPACWRWLHSPSSTSMPLRHGPRRFWRSHPMGRPTGNHSWPRSSTGKGAATSWLRRSAGNLCPAMRRSWRFGASMPSADRIRPWSRHWRSAAGISTDTKPLTPGELNQLVAEVAAKGDPTRGEQVFRRSDLSCMSCHALSKAGGDVGPDLSAVGQTSPADYIINSILNPDQSIKEQYNTLLVQTSEGQIFQGIVTDKDDQRIVLKEATGATRVVPVASVEDQKAGGSLMPKGLVNLMTHSEFVDLVRFLSELGKPGPYAIRSIPTLQRYRVLKSVPESVAAAVARRSTGAQSSASRRTRSLGDGLCQGRGRIAVCRASRVDWQQGSLPARRNHRLGCRRDQGPARFGGGRSYVD